MVSLSPTSVNIQTIVLGNILAITPEDTLQLVDHRRRLAGDPAGQVEGPDGRLLRREPCPLDRPQSRPRCKIMFFTLLAACTVAALQTVGAFLVIAMVVTPGATAYLLTDRFPRLIVHQRRDRHADQLRRRLSQLLPRRRDRRRHRRAADADLPRRLLLRAQARHARRPPPRGAGAGGRRMSDARLRCCMPFQLRVHAAGADHRRCWSPCRRRCCPASWCSRAGR